jgi:hypothetical protein
VAAQNDVDERRPTLRGLSRKRCALVGIIVGERSRHGVDAAATDGPTAHAASPRIRALKA